MDSDDAVGQGKGGWSRGRIFGVALGTALAAGLVILLILGLVSNNEDKLLFEQDIARENPPAAPEFELPVLFAGGPFQIEGAKVGLSALRGHPVVVNLWASWCPPCREEAPILQRIWERHRAKGAVVLGIDTQDGSDDARAFIREFKITYPSLRDGTDATQKKFQTTQLPETFVVDSQGRVRLVYRGAINAASEREISAFLEQAGT